MSLIYLLDTDVCVWAIRGRGPAAPRVRSRSPDELAVCSMTEAELRFGLIKRDSPANRIATEAFLDEVGTVLPFDSDAARRHAELRFAIRAQPIGEHDLLIASVAMANKLTLVTGNVREFSRIPGLKVENWNLP